MSGVLLLQGCSIHICLLILKLLPPAALSSGCENCVIWRTEMQVLYWATVHAHILTWLMSQSYFLIIYVLYYCMFPFEDKCANSVLLLRQLTKKEKREGCDWWKGLTVSAFDRGDWCLFPVSYEQWVLDLCHGRSSVKFSELELNSLFKPTVRRYMIIKDR